MKPENNHVVLNIDVKVFNDPQELFPLIHEIVSSYENYETALAPRLVLGLWHPKFLAAGREIVPYIRRTHIGMSTSLARKHFWADCDSFSMSFACLVGSDGEAFRADCKAAGKDVCESPSPLGPVFLNLTVAFTSSRLDRQQAHGDDRGDQVGRQGDSHGPDRRVPRAPHPDGE